MVVAYGLTQVIKAKSGVQDVSATWPAVRVVQTLGAGFHHSVLSHADVHGAHVLVHTDQSEHKHHEDNCDEKHHDRRQRRAERKQNNLWTIENKSFAAHRAQSRHCNASFATANNIFMVHLVSK